MPITHDAFDLTIEGPPPQKTWPRPCPPRDMGPHCIGTPSPPGHVQTCSFWCRCGWQAGGRLASHWSPFLFSQICSTRVVGDYEFSVARLGRAEGHGVDAV